MKVNREVVKKQIQAFVSNSSKDLELSVGWVTQDHRDCPKHLVDENDLFICGTKIINEENSDGSTMTITTGIVRNKNTRAEVRSVNFMFSESAKYVLCNKCLAWLRKHLEPLKTAPELLD